MIKVIKGTYGRVVGERVEAMTKRSAPFSMPAYREAELVAAGVAEYVEGPVKASPHAGMKMSELRRIAAEMGADVSGAKTKRDIIAILESAKAPEETPEHEADEV